VPQTPAEIEAAQLRKDIEMLRSVVSKASDRGADTRTLDACADLIRKRRQRLEELEHRSCTS
jgi:hypothetical protein